MQLSPAVEPLANRRSRDIQANTIAVLGPAGTNSHHAGAVVAPYLDRVSPPAPLFAEDMPRVIEAVVNGYARFGVLPAQNGKTGLVDHLVDFWLGQPDDRQLILSGDMSEAWADRVQTVAAVDLPVQHHLMARAGTDLRKIRTVISHPQALAQCRTTLARLGLTAVEASSTAEAARMVAAQEVDEFTAALANELAAIVYGLTILYQGVQDAKGNTTRLHILGSCPTYPTEDDLTSLIVWLPNEPCALKHIIDPISQRGLNMRSIHDIALGELDEVAIFLTINGHMCDPLLAAALQQIANRADKLVMLGSYPTPIHP